jgi:Fic family protein
MPKWDVDFNCRLDLRNQEIVSCVAKVEALAQVIRGVPMPPALQDSINQLNILRAVRGTTGIEGVELTESEVREIMSAPPGKRVLPPSRQRDEQEARNAEKVMLFVGERLRQEPHRPVTEDLIRELHRLTTEGIDYPQNEPGVYRNHAVSAGTYVPPQTGDEVQQLMREFVEWLREGPPRGWPATVKAVVAHFYLVSIHPFGDGNGRTARGLESYLLYQGGINARGFYSLANYYYQRRSEYEAMLDHVRFQTNGDITPFVQFALRGLVAEQEWVQQLILAEVTLIAFRDFARETLITDGRLGTKPGERMFHFLLGLPPEPVPIAQLRKGGHQLSELYRGVTAKTLSRDLNYLEKRQLIKVENASVRPNWEIMTQFMP